MNRPPILPQGLPPGIAQDALNKFHNTPPDLASLQNLAKLAAKQQHVKDQNKMNLVQHLVSLGMSILLLRLALFLLPIFVLMFILL